jgi:hypothetical protein
MLIGFGTGWVVLVLVLGFVLVLVLVLDPDPASGAGDGAGADPDPDPVAWASGFFSSFLQPAIASPAIIAILVTRRIRFSLLARGSIYMLLAMRCLVLLVAIAACGPRERMEPEPPWVADYQAIAREGCECQDPECLDAAYARAMKMEADHGGIDEAPPSVQTAHGELDKCWREGTRDLARDLRGVADAVCRCRDNACIQDYRLRLVQIEDKYGVDTKSSQLEPAAAAQVARADQCIADVTIPGDDYITELRGYTAALCACDDEECAKTEIVRAPPSFGDRFHVADVAAIQSDFDSISKGYCDCFQIVRDKVLKDVPDVDKLQTKVSLLMHCNRKDR